MKEILDQAYEQWLHHLGDNVPPETERLGELISISKLIEQGEIDTAREKILYLVEQYPGEFEVHIVASSIFQRLGLQEEAYKSLMMMLVLRPDLASMTCKRIAKYMHKTDAPNRAQVMLDLGWEQEKKTLRKKDWEAARQQYYGT
jgi:predicted Zn-dependent protease